ncbi:MAG TPA: ABC transporter ATP-binding protein [Bacillota bacterium]|nr:ABC transporter ATP-binding protein [Bacillota bacterium]
MIEFKNIVKQYNAGPVVLKDINLTCNDGEITVFIGPSGCGKTTTMKLINRIISPTEGSVYIDGKDISTVDPVKLRRKIGYVIQSIGLFPHMTIAQNVSVVPKLLKWDQDKIEQKVDELLNMVGLPPETYRDRYPNELSGGQQQRIGVIRALAAEPDIILMDEPFSALDPISREQLQDELNRLQKDIKKTIVFVTHDMDEALKIADRIVLMKDGEIVQSAEPEELLRRPANDFVVDFIGKKRLEQVTDVPTVGEVMVRKPIAIYENRGLAQAVKMMETNQVDSLAVLDNDDYVKGYISIYDVNLAFDNEETRVKDILQPFSKVFPPDMPLPEAVKSLDNSELSYIPIVDKDERLIGMLTRGSVVGYLREVYAENGIRGA